MTDGRRLLGVGVVVTLAALVGYTHVWGDPARDAGKPGARPVGDPVAVRGERQFSEALAASRFASSPVVTYRTTAGETLFALQVQPKLEPTPGRPRDYTVLIDTSASQAKGPLAASRQLVETLIAKMGADDRIALLTANTETKDLTRGLKSARETGDALKKLREEYPAGATNLKTALETAVKTFDPKDGRQQVIVFLGDGMSILAPLSAKDRAEIAAEMVKNEITFFPVPVGTRMDPTTLHGLASATGGAPVRILTADKPETTVTRLQQTLSVPVLYPTDFKLTGGIAEAFPTKLPPLRADLPTLVVGKLAEGEKVGYEVNGTVAGKAVRATGSEKVPASEVENFFLVSMVGQWRTDKDAPALIRADRALAYAYEQNHLARADLVAKAELAITEKKFEAALKLFQQAGELNPHDPEAKAGVDLVRKLKDGTLTLEKLREKFAPKPGDVLRPVGKGGKPREKILALARQDEKKPGAEIGADPKADPRRPGADVGGDPIAPLDRPRDIIREARDRQAVEDQRTTLVIEEALRQASRTLRIDPDAAKDQLKRMLDAVTNNPDLSERTRLALTQRLQAGLRSVEVQGARIKLDLEQRLALAAAAQARTLAFEAELAGQDRIRARMRQYKNLMDVAREEDAARVAQQLRQDLINQGQEVPPAVQAGYVVALAAHNFREIDELRRVRNERFLLTMMQVERSHVPFPDEPPVQFPPAGAWRELTKIRKERYESSQLLDDNMPPGVKAAMRKHKDMIDTPITWKLDPGGKEELDEVLDMLRTRYELNIEYDEAALRAAAEGGDPEKIIKAVVGGRGFNFQNISFGTALQKILSVASAGAQLNNDALTYIIRRETIEITTVSAARAELVTRVYPVADLVYPILDNGQTIPINPLTFNSQAIFGGFGFQGNFGGVQNFGQQFANFGQNFGQQFGNFGNFGQQFGNFGQQFNGGQFTPPGGGQIAGGFLQWPMLESIIKQTIGLPSDWAGNIQLNPPVIPGQPAPEPDPQYTGKWQLGYYPPARAMIVKAPARINTNLKPPPTISGPPVGAVDPRLAKAGDDEGPLGKKPDTKIAGAGDKRKETLEDIKKRLPMADADPKVIWQEIFEKGIDDPGLVIACADYMVDAGRFDHAVEFLKANLRQGVVVTPTIYEALAIALRESKASPEEVERAELSASDLQPLDASGFLQASRALGEQKRFDRAAAYCRQAAELSPETPHAYEDALTLAESAKDATAMAWAASHILSRDWPNGNQALHNKAHDLVHALAKTLDKDGKKDEADKLRAVLTAQRRRDIIIKLSWQGEADLDLKVEEPTGSVCTWLNRQTVGGGTLVGDMVQSRQDSSEATGSETYAAAEAFSGFYKVSVSRAWGRSLNNKARLDVTLHAGTPQETTKPITVDLSQNPTVTLKLDDGRRTEAAFVPPPSALERAEGTALPEAQSVMTKLRSLTDTGSTVIDGGMRAEAAGNARARRPAVPKTGSDQVVYQTRMAPYVANSGDVMAQAVVSSDRRSVRLSLSTLMNGVGGVANRPVINNPIIPGGAP